MSATTVDRREGAAVAAVSDATQLIIDPESLLIDNAAGITYSLKNALDDLGLPHPEQGLEGWSRMQMPLPDLFSILIGSENKQEIGRFFHCFTEHFHRAGRYMGRLRSGSSQLLEQLTEHDAFDLHFVSHIGAKAAARVLDTYGLGAYLKSIVTTDEPGCPGVRIQLLKSLIERSPLPRKSWMVLSDHPWELMTAQTLGARGLALAYGRAPLQVLNTVPAEALASNVGAVGAHLFDDAQHPRVVRLTVRPSARLH